MESVREANKMYMRKYIANAKTVECECGSSVKAYRKYVHLKSKKHLKYLEKESKLLEQEKDVRYRDLEERFKKLEQKLLKY